MIQVIKSVVEQSISRIVRIENLVLVIAFRELGIRGNIFCVVLFLTHLGIKVITQVQKVDLVQFWINLEVMAWYHAV